MRNKNKRKREGLRRSSGAASKTQKIVTIFDEIVPYPTQTDNLIDQTRRHRAILDALLPLGGGGAR